MQAGIHVRRSGRKKLYQRKRPGGKGCWEERPRARPRQCGRTEITRLSFLARGVKGRSGATMQISPPPWQSVPLTVVRSAAFQPPARVPPMTARLNGRVHARNSTLQRETTLAGEFAFVSGAVGEGYRFGETGIALLGYIANDSRVAGRRRGKKRGKGRASVCAHARPYR